MPAFRPPRYIVWSTDQIDLSDPFQRRWYLRQVLMHGRADDIRELDFDLVKRELKQLDLSPEIDSLWNAFFQTIDANR